MSSMEPIPDLVFVLSRHPAPSYKQVKDEIHDQQQDYDVKNLG